MDHFRSKKKPRRGGVENRCEGHVKADEYSRFSALNPAERGGNSRAKTVGLRPAVVREQAV